MLRKQSYTPRRWHLAAATKNTSVASRGDAYCLPGVEVDGQDVMAVHEAAKQAIHRARKAVDRL